MNPRVKEILAEAGLPEGEPGAARVMNELLSDPTLLVHVEPPAGYEAQLLAALKKKLPSEKGAPASKARVESPRDPLATPSFFSAVAAFFRAPQVAWGTAGAFGLLFAISMLTLRFAVVAPRADYDLVAQTALKGGREAVSMWLSSVGDAATRYTSAGRDMQSMAKTLSEADEKTVDRAIAMVTRDLGMHK